MFEYIQEQLDIGIANLFDSPFVINATINIAGEDIGTESTYDSFGDSFDGKHTKAVKLNYPQELKRYYRVKAFPMDRTSIRSSSNMEAIQGISGRYEPFDRWIACQKSDVTTGENKTFFDFAESVVIDSFKYSVKGVAVESFGSSSLIYAFLTKEGRV